MSPEPERPPNAASGGESAGADLFFDSLARAPYLFDFFQALRRIEAIYRDRPRLGESVRPAEEPLRLGQEPSLAFPPSTIASFRSGGGAHPARMAVHFFGLLGPNGPLPLHLTEHARSRIRHHDDDTFARFLDVFHHRMLALFYRAWANGQPAAGRDRPELDPFTGYVGSLIGIGSPAFRDADAVPDRVKLYYSGRLSCQTRNAEGLRDILSDFFRLPVAIEEHVGEWVDLPDLCRWRLGLPPRTARLGLSTTLGARVWMRQQKFRVVMGPMDRGRFERLLPGGESFRRLVALVRTYVGDELAWDARMVLAGADPMRLGQFSRLGVDSWLGTGRDGGGQKDVVVSPPAA